MARTFLPRLALALVFGVSATLVAAQTSTGSSDSAATSTDKTNTTPAATKSKRASSRHAKKTTSSGNPADNVTGNTSNDPTNNSPGVYNPSGAAMPRTSDPMQTKSMRDGSPPPSKRAGAASAAGAK